MTANINPYEAPKTESSSRPPAFLALEEIGLWRQGNLLVMHESARFPPRCILTGEMYAQHYHWQARNFWTTVYVVVPLSDEYVRRYRLQALSCITLALVSIFGGLVWEWPTGWLPFGGICVALAWYGATLQPLRLWTWDGSYHWIEGVHPDFLADLPPWPYQPR